MTKIDLAHQVQGVLPRAYGGTDNAHGMANTAVVVRLYNDSGGTLASGEVVTKTEANRKLHKAATAGQPIVGIVVGSFDDSGGAMVLGDCASADVCAVVVSGYTKVLTTSAATPGDYLAATATAGQAAPTVAKPLGAWGYCLIAGSSSECYALVGNIESTGATPYGTPAIVLGTAAAAGSATTLVRTDATIVAFDAVAPSDAAMGDSAAVGTQPVASRRDHKHGMPSNTGTPSTQDYGDSASIGASAGVSRSDHKHAFPILFDASNPTTQAFGDAPVVGVTATAAHRDHKHGMPTAAVGEILIVDTPSTPLVFADLVQNDDQNDLLYAD